MRWSLLRLTRRPAASSRSATWTSRWTHNAKEGALYVNVLNRSEKQDIATRIDNVEGTLAAAVGVWEMNHSDLKATHTFGADQKVLPKTSTVTAKIEKNGFTYTFPKHSLTILKLKVQ